VTSMTTAEVAPLSALPVGGVRPKRAPLGRLLRSELRWVFGRPRTLVGLGLLAIAPIAVGIGTAVVGNDVAQNGDQGPPISALGANALTLPVISLSMLLLFLLPLVATIAAADAIAGESASGTLRGLLVAPVSRMRLLAVKSFGVAVVVTVAVALIVVVAVVTGLIMHGTGGIVTLSGTTLSLGDTLARVALVAGWALLQLFAVCAIALAVSACTEHPLVVLSTMIGGLIVIGILGGIPALDWLQPFLLSDNWTAGADVTRDPVFTGDLGESALRALCYLVIGYSLATARMVTKDS
jgi:ABC-2 type transport system permease protein